MYNNPGIATIELGSELKVNVSIEHSEFKVVKSPVWAHNTCKGNNHGKTIGSPDKYQLLLYGVLSEGVAITDGSQYVLMDNKLVKYWKLPDFGEYSAARWNMKDPVPPGV